MIRRLRGLVAVLTGGACVVAACMALAPALAFGADTVYWVGDTDVLSANLDGTGAAELVTRASPLVTVDHPLGVAIDSGAGRVYWANFAVAGSISSANLDGSGPQDLRLTSTNANAPVSVNEPATVAVDPAGGRVYWTNFGNNTISSAKLDGSDAHDLRFTSANVNQPVNVAFPDAVAVDPVGRRIYWTNYGSQTISSATLDGSDAKDLHMTDAQGLHVVTGAQPDGVAVDPVGGRVYWTTAAGVFSARLDGSDAARLATGTATVATPNGMAFDPVTRTVYWGNGSGGTQVVSFAQVDGASSGDLVSTTLGSAGGYPALLLAPAPAGAPTVTGGSVGGSVLSCSQGAWGADFTSSFVYRAPHSFLFQWSRNGADIPGATASTLATDRAGGDYGCRVTAVNHAGSAVQTSVAAHLNALTAAPPTFGSRTLVTLKLASARVRSTGPVLVKVANANAFTVTGKLSARTVKPVAAAHKRRVALRSRAFTLAAHKTVTLKLALPRTLRRLLASKHSLALALSAVVSDPARNHRTVKVTLVPRLRAR